MIKKLDDSTAHLIRSNVLLKNPDSNILSVILSSLIKNSLESQATMIKVNLTIFEDDDGVWVSKLKIIDNGAGISWRKLDSIDSDNNFKGKMINSLVRL